MSTPEKIENLPGLADVDRMREVVTRLRGELETKNKELARVNEELYLANEELKRMALTDPLTHLFNRRYFIDQAEKEIARHNRGGNALSLLLVDIDHFKKINDTRGHQLGDSVLITVGSILVDSLRQHDIVARYGGEEFIVLLTDTDTFGAASAAEKIRARIETRRFPGMESERVTVSIGAGTLAVDRTDSLHDFIERVDQALGEAKRAGRNRIVTAA